MSQTISTELARGLEYHQKGQLSEAEEIYRGQLSEEPGHREASQLLGALLVQDNRAEQALPLLQAVLTKDPNNSVVLGNLGTAYSRLNDYPQAIASYRSSLTITPKSPDVAANLGSVLLKTKQFDQAVPVLRHALELSPGLLSIHMNLAIALLKTEQSEEACEQFELVLAQQPMYRQALAGLGQLLLQREETDERAVDCWQRLTQLEPDNPSMYNNLATTLKGRKQFAEAEVACRKALELRPDFFPAMCNFGLILAAQSRFEEARHVLRQAVALLSARDDSAADESQQIDVGIDSYRTNEFACIAYCQLAATTNMLGEHEEARWAITKGLEINPNDVESRMMRGFLHLQVGEFEKGWPDYECRKLGKQAPRKFPAPEWTGEPQPDKTILLHAEQGLGDSIHFIRYARLVKERVGRVVFLCHKPLAKLMRLFPDIDQVIADGETLPTYDFQVPLLSLPAVFNTTWETVPRQVPYLLADAELEASWRERLQSIDGFRIGIAWQGNKEFANDLYRRVPLRQFKIFADLPGVRLINLQKGDGSEQLAEIDFELTTFSDVDTTAGAFMDTAAIMKNVDLVISPCTATPHLAGALGVPVWLAKSFAAEWRWLADDRQENPWYPTMRMFRQPTLGDWETVFQRMTSELRRMI